MTESTSASMSSSGATAIVGIVGAGITGQAVGRVVRQIGLRSAWFDTNHDAARRAAALFGGVVVSAVDDLAVADTVVLASPGPHARLTIMLLTEHCPVVSAGDDVDDIAELLDLHAFAVEQECALVVGAALSPGLSGLLARHLSDQLAEVDEMHIAMHGTGGPACARQHHHALGSRGRGWHDGAWIERPGGSGRELVWFPEPIGPADCYRGALGDPLVLHRAFPAVDRISARISATRRDRLTARLPLLAPPHAGGDRGAIRVEVRGAAESGERITSIVGAVGRTGDMAGTVAALFARESTQGRLAPGVVVAGDDSAVSARVLAGVVDAGVLLQEYTGIARPAKAAHPAAGVVPMPVTDR